MSLFDFCVNSAVRPIIRWSSLSLSVIVAWAKFQDTAIEDFYRLLLWFDATASTSWCPCSIHVWEHLSVRADVFNHESKQDHAQITHHRWQPPRCFADLKPHIDTLVMGKQHQASGQKTHRLALLKTYWNIIKCNSTKNKNFILCWTMCNLRNLILCLHFVLFIFKTWSLVEGDVWEEIYLKQKKHLFIKFM